MDSGERGMNPVAMTIISPQKEYWANQASNQRPPVLKSAMLPTGLWGSGICQLRITDMGYILFKKQLTFLLKSCCRGYSISHNLLVITTRAVNECDLIPLSAL